MMGRELPWGFQKEVIPTVNPYRTTGGVDKWLCDTGLRVAAKVSPQAGPYNGSGGRPWIESGVVPRNRRVGSDEIVWS